MVKRQAELPLEAFAAEGSPATKKARMNGFSSVSSHEFQINSTAKDLDEQGGQGVLKAAQEDQEEDKEKKDENEDEDEEEVGQNEKSAYSATSRQEAPTEGYSDLYLDTINRSVLDFDFEKLCSVTLSNINVYACLVCGKYYQGRGPKSHAYYHALEVGHHVYVNMQTKRVYVLPEGYEVKSKSLDDIKFVVDPQLSRDEVAQIDREAKDAWDLAGKKYRPGMEITLSSLCRSN